MSNTVVIHVGCFNKTRWEQARVCLQTYGTTLSPSPRSRREAAPAFALNAVPDTGNIFSKRSCCASFPSARDECWLASQMGPCLGSWFLHGLFCGDVFSSHTAAGHGGSALINQTDYVWWKCKPKATRCDYLSACHITIERTGSKLVSCETSLSDAGAFCAATLRIQRTSNNL